MFTNYPTSYGIREYRVFWLPCLFFFPTVILVPKIKGREGHLPLQIDKYKEKTGFDVYSVKTFNDYTMFSNTYHEKR